MTITRPLSGLLVLLACTFAASLRVQAETLTQTGIISTDDTVIEIPFTLTSNQTDNFFTTSYGGGFNANGTYTASGGFDPVLTLYTGSGSFITEGGGDSMCHGSASADASTGLCNDAYFTEALNAGSYLLALTEFPNYPNGDLSSGFFLSTDPTAISDACGAGSFLESDVSPCAQRNGNYAVNISTVTPEPSTWLLMIAPLTGIVVRARRKLA